MARTPPGPPKGKTDAPPGGKALKRVRQFEQARGLTPVHEESEPAEKESPDEKPSGKGKRKS